ncbi:S1 RNA-binding domain-containing protein [Streptomyces sp. NPDC088789]|uniref:S1 RNA-binding domain-containing protein n=1 Tax=Streptomyces sp. NPDC088789 TaxID=3365899 RepID=UPI0037F2497C
MTKVLPFGVFVRVGEAAVGLLHSSDLPEGTVALGQELTVRLLEIDRACGRVRLGPPRDRPGPAARG